MLANSIKFTEKGSIKIEAIEKSEIIMLKVIDTGKGIEKNIQKNLFNPFVSYSNSGSTEGIGLGLSTTRKLVERLGPTEKITIQSEIKKGSIFSFQVYKQIEDTGWPIKGKKSKKWPNIYISKEDSIENFKSNGKETNSGRKNR